MNVDKYYENLDKGIVTTSMIDLALRTLKLSMHDYYSDCKCADEHDRKIRKKVQRLFEPVRPMFYLEYTDYETVEVKMDDFSDREEYDDCLFRHYMIGDVKHVKNNIQLVDSIWDEYEAGIYRQFEYYDYSRKKIRHSLYYRIGKEGFELPLDSENDTKPKHCLTLPVNNYVDLINDHRYERSFSFNPSEYLVSFTSIDKIIKLMKSKKCQYIHDVSHELILDPDYSWNVPAPNLRYAANLVLNNYLEANEDETGYYLDDKFRNVVCDTFTRLYSHKIYKVLMDSYKDDVTVKEMAGKLFEDKETHVKLMELCEQYSEDERFIEERIRERYMLHMPVLESEI